MAVIIPSVMRAEGRPAPSCEWLIGAIVAVQALAFVATTSGTFDELTYLQLGRAAWQHFDFSGFATFGVAPLPVLISYALPALGRVEDYGQAIVLARVSPIAFIGIPLGVLV